MQTLNSQTLNVLIRKIETENLALYRFCDKDETGLWIYNKERCEKAYPSITSELEDFKKLFKNFVTNEENLLQLDRNVSSFLKKHRLTIVAKNKKRYVSMQYKHSSEMAKFHLLFLE